MSGGMVGTMDLAKFFFRAAPLRVCLALLLRPDGPRLPATFIECIESRLRREAGCVSGETEARYQHIQALTRRPRYKFPVLVKAFKKFNSNGGSLRTAVEYQRVGENGPSFSHSMNWRARNSRESDRDVQAVCWTSY